MSAPGGLRDLKRIVCLPPLKYVRSSSPSFGTTIVAPQGLLRTNKGRILDSNVLGKMMGKKGNFNSGVLKPPESLSRDPLVWI